jgi:DNA-binding transcriptional ArsR family regulator
MRTLDFKVAVTIVGLMLLGLIGPILMLSGVQTRFGAWTIDTFVESLVSVPISVLFALVGPRLLDGWGDLSARFATAMLAGVEPGELKSAVGHVLTRTGRADAFEILDQLELRLGRGSFLTPTRLEARLLALESSGLVTARREGRRTTYALA